MLFITFHLAFYIDQKMYIKHFSITLAQYPADFDFKQYTTLYNIFYVYLSYILTMS